MTGWKLVDKTFPGTVYTVGARVLTHRGEPYTLSALHPPKHAASEGHVTITRPCAGCDGPDEHLYWCQGTERGTYYASVIGARFIPANVPA